MGGNGQPPARGDGGGEKGLKEVLLVILVGAPGSGKSTFCDQVMKASRRPWVRVCQDTIANGKAGTKLQCIKSAANALQCGKSVFVDRCNLEQEQRNDFVKLGGGQVDVHSVVLDLPAQLCISRSVKRNEHEGNLQGGKAAAVVNRMLQKKELPKLSEGFSRITFCQNENDVQEAVRTYSTVGPSDILPSGCFGQRNQDARVQLGIMKFFQKAEIPVNAASSGNGARGSISKQDVIEKNGCDMQIQESSGGWKATESNDSSEKSVAYCKDISTLAFPSISTSDFQFNHEKASDIITDVIAGFLNKVDNVRLVLVDLSHGSNILSLVRAKAESKKIDPNKFFTVVGDITQLFTKRNLHCNAIANAANWRLRPGGGGVNAAIYNAAGKELEIATQERAGTLSPGSSVVVPLPSTSPLYQREGVTHVIHVLGPNMNPQRPNCLRNDYTRGCKVLREAYSSLFENFATIVKTQAGQKKTSRESGHVLPELNRNTSEGCSINQSADSDSKMKREDCYNSEQSKKCKGDGLSEQNSLPGKGNSGHNPVRANFSDAQTGSSGTTGEPVERLQKNCKIYGNEKRWGSWAQALHRIALHPEKDDANVTEISDDYVVLNDLYPKAKKHILVLSRLSSPDHLADVRKEHLPLLKTMHSVGLKWAEKFLHDDPSLTIRLGYHSVPSMRQLHLHVISQDFDSMHLKNKKHWNSFNTEFFRDSPDVMEEIEKYGMATVNSENLLSTELRCHRCRSAHPNIPRLKAHISKCGAPFPSSLLQNDRLVRATSSPVCKG